MFEVIKHLHDIVPCSGIEILNNVDSLTKWPQEPKEQSVTCPIVWTTIFYLTFSVSISPLQSCHPTWSCRRWWFEQEEPQICAKIMPEFLSHALAPSPLFHCWLWGERYCWCSRAGRSARAQRTASIPFWKNKWAWITWLRSYPTIIHHLHTFFSSSRVPRRVSLTNMRSLSGSRFLGNIWRHSPEMVGMKERNYFII